MSRATRPNQFASLELSPVVSQQYALGLKHLLMTVGVATFFLYHNYLPLSQIGVWADVAFGEWIVDHNTLPSEDPFVRLAEGVRTVNSAWLGQVCFALIERTAGSESLSHLFAFTVLATYLILAGLFFHKTRQAGLAMMGAFIVWAIGWSGHQLFGTEIFGSLCFATLLCLIATVERDNSHQSQSASHARGVKKFTLWIGIPVLFAVWVNLDSSFVFGIAVLACCMLGHGFDLLWRSRSLTAVWKDRVLRRWLILLELAVAASLLNPYGVDLLITLLGFSASPNLANLPGWQRLDLASAAGIPIALSWLLLLVALRHSRVKVTASEVLLLSTFSVAVVLQIRFAALYAVIVMFVLMPHLADVIAQLRGVRPTAVTRLFAQLSQGRSFRYSLLTFLAVWMAFAFSPASQPILGGKRRTPSRLYQDATPLGVTNFLQQHPPEGQIFNPRWWGDWLVFRGPRDMQVLMTTRSVHAVPNKVWRDYRLILHGEKGFEDILDRYRMNTLVVDKENQRRLTVKLRALTGWKVVYEDEQGLVAVRESTVVEESSQPMLEVATASSH